MNLKYIFLRTTRHFLPETVTRFLLRHGFIIRPGIETRSPVDAVNRYEAALAERDISLTGKRMIDFGYGGNFATGVELLRRGASQVILCDKYAPPDDERNRTLLPEYSKWLIERDGHVCPKSGSMTLLQGDIRDAAREHTLEPVDIILSSSVYEHLDDVSGITRALCDLTKPGGVGLHYIDLRDHYFKLPFEMLAYSPSVWERWLNPTSNLNRFRMWDYRRIFNQYYKQVEMRILESEPGEYKKALSKIRLEFISTDEQENAAIGIRVIAAR